MKHEILIYNQTKARVPKKITENIILKVLDFLKIKQPVELAVLIVESEEIRKLNKIWRGENESVDELSFGLNSRKTAGFVKNNNNVLELGEIVISVDKVSNKSYLSKMLVHSLLHLLGHHHEKSAVKAKKTEWLEEKILKHLEI